jgi:phosphoglucomutase
MSGLLIAEYQLSQKKKLGLLPKVKEDGALVTTIVSSKMAYAIARQYDLTVIEVLTGFKYIGEAIKNFEQAIAKNGGKLNKDVGAYEYEFGYEESYGCLVGTHARDKDAVMAVAALSEAAAYYKMNGLTLCDVMENMYKKYGYYLEDLATTTLTGVSGAQQIAAIMQKLRDNHPALIGGLKVVGVRDYKQGIRWAEGKKEKLTLPNSDVLYFELENDGWCCVRPSGTEPKIKFYFGVMGKTRETAQSALKAVKDDLLKLADD